MGERHWDQKSVEVTRWGLRKGKADRETGIESDGLGHPDNG